MHIIKQPCKTTFDPKHFQYSQPEVLMFWHNSSHIYFTVYLLSELTEPFPNVCCPSLEFHYIKITAAHFTFFFFSLFLSPLLPSFPSQFWAEQWGCIECFPLHKISIREFADCAALLQWWWWCFFISSLLGLFPDTGPHFIFFSNSPSSFPSSLSVSLFIPRFLFSSLSLPFRLCVCCLSASLKLSHLSPSAAS